MEETIARYQTEMEELQKSRKEIIRQAKEEAERMLQESNARIENTIRTIKEAQAEKEKTRMARQELTDFRTSLDALASKEQEEKMARKMEKLKEKQEQQVIPASREETVNRLEVIEQRILEVQDKSGIPENTVRNILSQIASIKKGQSENQKQDLEDIKGLIVASHRYFKEKLKILFPADTHLPEKTESSSLYDKLLNGVTLYLKPKFFLFSAGILICLVSLVLNIRFAERMQQLQDNDIKYRYLLMKGKADGSSLDLLEMNFSWKRDNAFIQSITDMVIDFEYRSRKQAEALERARLLDEQAKQLKKEADKLRKP